MCQERGLAQSPSLPGLVTGREGGDTADTGAEKGPAPPHLASPTGNEPPPHPQGPRVTLGCSSGPLQQNPQGCQAVFCTEHFTFPHPCILFSAPEGQSCGTPEGRPLRGPESPGPGLKFHPFVPPWTNHGTLSFHFASSNCTENKCVLLLLWLVLSGDFQNGPSSLHFPQDQW